MEVQEILSHLERNEGHFARSAVREAVAHRDQIIPPLLEKFALPVKVRFNPFRDSAGCTIVMRWQRRLKSHFLMTKPFFLQPGQGTVHIFCEQLSPVDKSACNSKPKSSRQIERDSFCVGRNDLANYTIADWAQSLGQKSRERFACRREQGHYVVPSESILRNVLIRVTPADLDRALQCWNERYGAGDDSLATDGKTMCNALDEQGQRTHVMSVVGQQSKICYTQKKWAPCP